MSPVATGSVWWPLLLATLAGLSTSIGAVIAINLAPDEATLAFLLGSAVGVMSTVSIAELWWHKAVEHSNWVGITAAVVAGGMVFAIVDPLLPKQPEPQLGKDDTQETEPFMVKVHSHPKVTVATSVKRQSFTPRQAGAKLAAEAAGQLTTSVHSPKVPAALSTQNGAGSHSSSASNSSNGASTVQANTAAAPSEATIIPNASRVGFSDEDGGKSAACVAAGSTANTISSNSRIDGNVQSQLQLLRSHHADLLRLGILMALTMTLHNMPEGFAVAFSAMTSVGPFMCGAIAAHNIPEGLVIAAPIYAATGSKLRAFAVATLSGLSEPLGASVALFLFRPFVNSVERLDFVLAFVGGIMLAVCVLELWPEGRKCRQDVRLLQGLVLGSVLMGWTLYAGV